MIVMIEETPKAAAWVQHHHELVKLLGQDYPSHPDKWTFLGLPLRIADTKKWNELLLLEGSKKVTALDWPPLMTQGISGEHIVQGSINAVPLARSFTKYLA